MLELMLGGGRGRVIGDTGPGPTELIGSYTDTATNKTTGFFGETTDLYTMRELYDALVSVIGKAAIPSMSVNAERPWLKFLIDGDILFVAKRPSFWAVSYNQLKAANLLEKPGVLLPASGGYQFRVRSMNAMTAVYDSVANSLYPDHPFTYGSEWNRLMYNIANDITPTSQKGGKWGSGYPVSELKVPSGAEILPGTFRYPGTSYHLTRNDLTQFNGNSLFDNSSSDRFWRPVLVLVK